MPETANKITGNVQILPDTVKKIIKSVGNLSDFKKELASSFNRDMTSAIEMLLGGAVNLNASDLHIEPLQESAKLRLRIDGVLQDVAVLEKKDYQGVLSRIKLLSELKINIEDRPQDGRFSVLWENLSIEVRVSTIPAEFGESVVLRILNPKNLVNLDALGLRADLLEIFRKEIKKPNGMIIVTGPTGSGKTTTLYAFLKNIYNPEIKIITIEDPIEYHLEGISQTQTEPEKGYDFASGLKSIMRQDPDVILVGEIRDLETVDIAIQAALTGHLVLTTLHTNDASGTITRMVSLGAKIQNIGPAVNMVIAQRLVRKVCEKCAVLRQISSEELDKIKTDLKGISSGAKFKAPDAKTKIPKVSGCKECNFTGYRGRVGIFEALLVDADIEKFILESPSVAALEERAKKRGMVTMRQDGILKVLDGMTTLEEVEKTTG